MLFTTRIGTTLYATKRSRSQQTGKKRNRSACKVRAANLHYSYQNLQHLVKKSIPYIRLPVKLRLLFYCNMITGKIAHKSLR
jgi:hypothetical protein